MTLSADFLPIPIVIEARKINTMQFHNISQYRLFKTGPDGTAIPIPFQIDERDQYGDFVLDQGREPNDKLGNGIFDYYDELSFMSEDMGLDIVPTKWPNNMPPNVLYRLLVRKEPGQTKDNKADEGVVFVGIYVEKEKPLHSTKSYVNYDTSKSKIITSRYEYSFDKENHLVVRNVSIFDPSKVDTSDRSLQTINDDTKRTRIVDSSTFFMKLDFKYLFTISIDQTDISSNLGAFKVGPIRSIARVNFDYKILSLKFDLGMYTDISFFSNSVILPAIVDNPLSSGLLNKGSHFYYGFELTEDPKSLHLESNMPSFQDTQSSPFDYLTKLRPESRYWVSALSNNFMFYFELELSQEMREHGIIPMVYKEHKTKVDFKKEKRHTGELGKSNVNLAIAVNLDKFKQGTHNIALQLFLDNLVHKSTLERYQAPRSWSFQAKRLTNPQSRQK